MAAYDQFNDEMLLPLIADGDETAFTALYNRYCPKIYAYLNRTTKIPEIAEELTYDIFTGLWTGRDLLPDIRNVNAFLSKVAYNKAMDFFRLAANRQRLQAVVASRMAHPVTTPNADERLLEAETKRILQEAIDHLSPQRRKVFIMHRELGMTHEQIAQALSLSPETVKTTMSKALKSMRAFLQQRGVESVILLYYLMSGK